MTTWRDCCSSHPLPFYHGSQRYPNSKHAFCLIKHSAEASIYLWFLLERKIKPPPIDLSGIWFLLGPMKFQCDYLYYAFWRIHMLWPVSPSTILSTFFFFFFGYPWLMFAIMVYVNISSDVRFLFLFII